MMNNDDDNNNNNNNNINNNKRENLLTALAAHSRDWMFAFPIASCGLLLDDKSVRTVVGLRLGLYTCVPCLSMVRWLTPEIFTALYASTSLVVPADTIMLGMTWWLKYSHPQEFRQLKNLSPEGGWHVGCFLRGCHLSIGRFSG